MDQESNELLTALVTALGVVAAVRLYDFLVERREASVNRYEAAVASESTATELAEPLEQLADKGLLEANGDPMNPNERTYRLSERLAAIA